jgi:outer membrane protein OmpA-like peptidoglycan-associated protein
MVNINKQYIKTLLVISITLFLSSGCAKTTIVLLPDPDGKIGYVTVYNDAGSIDITQAREATVVKGPGSQPTRPKVLSEEAIESKFSSGLASLPLQPVHFILYFTSESTELTADSVKILPEILESINSRKSQNISVIGHTDTAGISQYNLQLSQKRASAISLVLVQKGVDPSYIKSTFHGQMNPLVKTADNTHEPRNRRVEVVVR